jgi:hypothetical protein
MITIPIIPRRIIVKPTHRTFVLLMLAVAVLLTAAGCSEEDPVQVKEDPVIGPGTPEELVTQFMATYEARDVVNYLALLDPDFEMELTAETIEDFPDVGPTLDYAEEEQIHTRMFSGENVTDPNGNLVPGVQDISFSVLMALAGWSPSTDADPFPDTVWAPFEMMILFDRGQSFSTMKVEGVVKIYARAHEAKVDGAAHSYFLMAGMTDLTQFTKSTETFSWGSVKALYR